MNRERLILFTRFPVPGEVKSRLAAAVGADRACRIHDRLARHAWQQAKTWGGEVEIRISGATEQQCRAWLNAERISQQGDGSLGQRMERAVIDALSEGVERIVLIGSDCPGLCSGVLTRAFTELARCDVVFGPATDGGYYLIGLKTLHDGLFEGIDWGGPDVLAQSLAVVPDAVLLEPLSDVDTIDELEVMLQCNLAID